MRRAQLMLENIARSVGSPGLNVSPVSSPGSVNNDISMHPPPFIYPIKKQPTLLLNKHQLIK